MVIVKIAALLLFIALGVTAFNGDNFTPFYGGEEEGFGGVVTAASIIFFAYIGFDAISTSGEETRNPGRDLPIAILGSLGDRDAALHRRRDRGRRRAADGPARGRRRRRSRPP